MFIIFVFTIIFATLLIKEKYYEYQTTLQDKLHTIENQHAQEVSAIAVQVNNVIKHLGCKDTQKIKKLFAQNSLDIAIDKTPKAINTLATPLFLNSLTGEIISVSSKIFHFCSNSKSKTATNSNPLLSKAW